MDIDAFKGIQAAIDKHGRQLKDLLFEFELEFCLTREAYCKAYNEDGSVWDYMHARQMEVFHEIFKHEDGKANIIEGAQNLLDIYFKDKAEFANAFQIEEMSQEEIDFLKETISYLKPWDSDQK